MANKKEAIGFCKNWNEKGFGFIEILEGTDKGKTVFLHYSVMYSFYHKVLVKDEMVTVAYEQGEKGLKATDCWSNVYGYIHTSNFRGFEEKYSNTVINFNIIPKDICVHSSHIQTLTEYRNMIKCEKEALEYNMKEILAYKASGKDSWFSGKEYDLFVKETSKELSKYQGNKTNEFLMINPYTNKNIYIVKNFREFNIEEYWKNRINSNNHNSDSSGDGTGLFPQWEADGFDE